MIEMSARSAHLLFKRYLMKNKIFFLFLIFSFLMTSGFGCKGQSVAVTQAMKPVTLTYWRVFDDQDAFAEIIANYKKLHSYVTIEYKKFRYEEYEKELLNALAEDRGPDIFSIPSSWLTGYQNKLSPLPEQITMVYPVVKGTVQKQVVQELRTNRTLTQKELRNNFVDIVSNDVLLEKDGVKKIYGLPLFVDTLALYYNRDLLNNAGITAAPAYWNAQFLQDVKKLTKISKGNILQSGVAMGGSTNIERSSDILSLLMMQNGAVMQDGNSVLFHTVPEGGDRRYNPGLEALRFYIDFANPGKEVYCWDGSLKNSLDLFISGNLAMMFGYSYDLPTIKSRAPKMNFSIAKMPQIEGNSRQVNYANYWVEVVSNKSKNQNEAWDFIQFETSQEQVASYLKAVKKPTALRALVNSQIDDLDIGIFSEQVLTAQSWYHGKDAASAEKAIEEAIDLSVKNSKDIEAYLSQAAAKVQQTVQ